MGLFPRSNCPHFRPPHICFFLSQQTASIVPSWRFIATHTHTSLPFPISSSLSTTRRMTPSPLFDLMMIAGNTPIIIVQDNAASTNARPPPPKAVPSPHLPTKNKLRPRLCRWQSMPTRPKRGLGDKAPVLRRRSLSADIHWLFVLLPWFFFFKTLQFFFQDWKMTCSWTRLCLVFHTQEYNVLCTRTTRRLLFPSWFPFQLCYFQRIHVSFPHRGQHFIKYPLAMFFLSFLSSYSTTIWSSCRLAHKPRDQFDSLS